MTTLFSLYKKNSVSKKTRCIKLTAIILSGKESDKMKSIRKYLPLFAMLLLFIKPFVAVAISPQGSVEEVIIKNGEFNEGLKDWIVSSPGENNPSLVVDSNGNQYVKATNGETILQYVQLKPNSTYRFAYYVIGDPNFPAIVEFGTLNHDQGYHPLKEEKHYDISWKQHEFIFTTLTDENTYVIRFASSGNGEAKFDNIQAAWLDLESPSIPQKLLVESVASDTVSLSWKASTDNIGVAGYRVYRDKQLVQEVQGEQFTDTGLTEDTEYTYEVRAFDTAGNQSEASNRINVRTKEIVDHKPPTTPMNVRATVVTENKVTLLWEASSDESGIRSYLVYRNSILVGSLPDDTLSYTDTNLSEKTKYYYTITACDNAGNVSVASKALLITTKGTTLPPIVEEKPKEEKPSPSVPRPPQKENIGNSTVDASGNKMEKEQMGMINRGKNRPVDHSLNLTAEAIQKISKILTKDSVKNLPLIGTQKNSLVKMSGVGITAISLCLFYIRKRRK